MDNWKLQSRCTSCSRCVSYVVLQCLMIWTVCIPRRVMLSSAGSGSTPEEVMVYPGFAYLYHYTFHYANVSWPGAYHDCVRNNQEMVILAWDDFYKFFHTYAGHQSRSLPVSVWYGYYKDHMADEWHHSAKCEDGLVQLTPHNQSYSSRQCMLLDTTIPLTFNAVDCDMEVSYICGKFRGLVNYTRNAYIIYDNMDITGDRTHLSATFSELMDCIYMMFKDCFECYAAVYFDSSSWCVIYKTHPINLPMTVVITPSVILQTLVLKNETRVYFNDTSPIHATLATSYSEYPCDEETTSTSTTTETSMELTGSCVCECNYVNKTREMILQEMHQRSKELSIEKFKLSSYTRFKSSAKDDRTSSQAVGYVGILILAFTVILISTGDVMKLIVTLHRCFLKRKQKFYLSKKIDYVSNME